MAKVDDEYERSYDVESLAEAVLHVRDLADEMVEDFFDVESAE